MDEAFTPSVTGREWGKMGARTAGGAGARFALLNTVRAGIRLRTASVTVSSKSN